MNSGKAELKRIEEQANDWDPPNWYTKRLSKRRYRALMRDKIKGIKKDEQAD